MRTNKVPAPGTIRLTAPGVARAGGMRPGDGRPGRWRAPASWRAAAAIAVAGGLAVAAAPQALASPADDGRAAAAAAPSIKLSASTGTPTATVTISGSGFGASEGVDIYFDTTDEALAGANATGAFAKITLTVPASAVPGTHWISAQGRHSGLFAQQSFTVDTPWAAFGRVARNTRSNPFENVLNAGDVAGLDEAWSYPTDGGVFSSPAVAGGTAFAGSADGNLYAVNASTGAKVWSFAPGTVGDEVLSSPAVAGGVVYFGDVNGTVFAVNAATGAKLWSFATGAEVDSPPTVTRGIVYVGSSNDSIYALNAATGKQLWSFATSGFIQTSPAVANGMVYVTSSDGNLYALNAVTGTSVYSVGGLGTTGSSPAVSDGTVYVGSEDGSLYAYNLGAAAQAQAPRRPRPGSLHPDLHLKYQNGGGRG